MKFTDEDLMAYVDGVLDSAKRSRIEHAIDQDRSLAERIAALEASNLPYKAAYKQYEHLDVPESLRHQIEEWSSISSVQRRQHSANSGLWAVAASVMLALTIGYLAGNLAPWQPDPAPSTATQVTDDESNWVRVVAEYQSLYVPQTIAGVNAPLETAYQLFDRLDVAVATDMPPVPDLSAMGYRFMRAQQLGYRGEPLVQLVYQSGENKLLALCFMRDDAADRPAHQGIVSDQATMSWRHNGRRFVIVAQDKLLDLALIKSRADNIWL